jgi:selenocysteine lyase/cysteine desulfurase
MKHPFSHFTRSETPAPTQEPAGLDRRGFIKGMAAAALAGGLIDPGRAQAKVSPSALALPKYSPDLQPYPTIWGPRDSEQFWTQVRKAFLLPDDYIHMNTGTTGSQPRFSLNNLNVYNLYKSLDPRDWQLNLNADYPDLFPISGSSAISVRQAAIAAQYGANPDEIILSYNTTDACNLIFAGTPWNPGDRIITTHWEHPALHGPIAWARDYRGVDVRMVELPSNFTPDISSDQVLGLFESELAQPPGNGNKQYLAVSEIFYKNGLRLPVEALCQLARRYGAYTIIDTAHGWGQLPINCHAYGADFIAGAGHKWLCGGPGTGIFYVRNSGADEYPLPPFNMGNWFLYGNPFTSPSPYCDNRNWLPASLMQPRGELNTPALYAMTDAAAFFNYIGVQDIYDRGVALGDYLKGKIAVHWGANALWVRNPDPAFATALTSFNPFAGKDDPTQYDTLKSAITTVLNALAAEIPKIYIRSVTWRDRAGDPADNRIGFRISTHAVYNNPAEIDWMFERLVAAVNATGLPQLS